HRGRRCHGRGQADQDLRRLAIGHVAAQMRAEEDAIAGPYMVDILAGCDHAADRIGARHERHRRQAVGHLARQYAAHVGQHHAGLDAYQHAVGRRLRRLDIFEAQIVMRVQPPGLVCLCHVKSLPIQGKDDQAALGSSPSISAGSSITTRPPAMSTVGTTALENGSSMVAPLGGAISMISPAPKLWIATTLPSASSAVVTAASPIRSAW